jgi:hypothetical protein
MFLAVAAVTHVVAGLMLYAESVDAECRSLLRCLLAERLPVRSRVPKHIAWPHTQCLGFEEHKDKHTQEHYSDFGPFHV